MIPQSDVSVTVVQGLLYYCEHSIIQFPVSVEAKLSFVEPGRRWAHSPSRSKTPGISYQGRPLKTSVRMLKTAGGLELLYGASFCFLRRFRWTPEGLFFL